MGAGNHRISRTLIPTEELPSTGEFELTLFGPRYGESVVLHIGGGVWLIVDSCLSQAGLPKALEYLEQVGVKPERDVALIVATHWHDDHIRGMATLVERCANAKFCCAAALTQQEFLAAIHALENRHLSSTGSGVREFHRVISGLRNCSNKLILAQANRRIFSCGSCDIWSLSPGDSAYLSFLKSIGTLIPSKGQGKHRAPDNSPNQLAVALWIAVEDVVVLLGSDLERPGWIEVLQSHERPYGKASAFKVPHHGSRNAHEPGVWQHMLDSEPVAALTPWRRGKGSLPTRDDVERILSFTSNGFASAKSRSLESGPSKRIKMVDRTIRESGISLRRLPLSTGAVRLRRSIGDETGWRVDTFGPACHLGDFFQ